MHRRGAEPDREAIHKVAVLRSTQLFSTLTDELLKKIAGLALSRHLERGQVLCSEHEEAVALYVVATGELRAIRQTPDGREQVLSTERPGAVLGAVPVFNGGKFYSTIIADIPSEVLSIEKHQIHELCREHSELLWNIAKVLAHRLRQYAELIESLALRNVEQRVAQYLCAAAYERGAPVAEGCVVELTSTRVEIASRIGSVREVVSRAFAQLENAGLIHIEGVRLITIPRVKALSAFARGESDATEKHASNPFPNIV